MTLLLGNHSFLLVGMSEAAVWIFRHLSVSIELEAVGMGRKVCRCLSKLVTMLVD